LIFSAASHRSRAALQCRRARTGFGTWPGAGDNASRSAVRRVPDWQQILMCLLGKFFERRFTIFFGCLVVDLRQSCCSFTMAGSSGAVSAKAGVGGNSSRINQVSFSCSSLSNSYCDVIYLSIGIFARQRVFFQLGPCDQTRYMPFQPREERFRLTTEMLFAVAFRSQHICSGDDRFVHVGLGFCLGIPVVTSLFSGLARRRDNIIPTGLRPAPAHASEKKTRIANCCQYGGRNAGIRSSRNTETILTMRRIFCASAVAARRAPATIVRSR